MSAKKYTSSSLVWEFFVVGDNPTKARCKCNAVYTRGKTPKTYSTKSLLKHIKKKHLHEYEELKRKKETSMVGPSSSNANDNAKDVMDITTAKSSQRPLKQTTIAETFQKLKQFGANDPTQIKLNHKLVSFSP